MSRVAGWGVVGWCVVALIAGLEGRADIERAALVVACVHLAVVALA